MLLAVKMVEQIVVVLLGVAIVNGLADLLKALMCVVLIWMSFGECVKV